MTTKINADANGLTETVDTSGILEFQTANTSALVIDASQNANFTSTGAITVPAGTTAQRPTPVNGMMRYNSNVAVFEVYANNVWSAANVTPSPTNTVAPVISGSAVVGQNLTCTTGTWSGSPSAYFYQWRANSTAISNATANVFTLTSTQTGANITCNVIAQNIAGNSSPATSNTLGPVIQGVTASYLIVAGGGSGGAGWAGGGGAGGLQTGSTILQPANTYAITIGAGGAGVSTGDGNSGSNSSVGSLTASVGGGGGGGADGTKNGKNGGSGGGAEEANTPGTGTAGQGYAGAAGNGGSVSNASGGGGGGASQAGIAGSVGQGGSGGNGASYSISGTATYYAGGGGGAGGSVGAGSGGLGGGGAGNYNSVGNCAGTPGTANLGGGGGASSYNGSSYGTSGNGGSGIVIISYAGAQQFGGGVISTDGSNTIHTFYTSGSLVPLTALSANYLIVAGGGGGGSFGGGGGAGGLLSGSNVTIDSSSTYAITVGAGGSGGAANANKGVAGGNSSFSMVSTTAIGGGFGGGNAVGQENGGNGGSGGGAAAAGSGASAGSGTSGQGFAGGSSPASSPYPAGGGGGSSQVGFAGTGSASGAGGNGTSSSISGTATYYAGGGGGAGGTYYGASAGAGGLGGGGAGSASGVGTAGTAGTGGGGGGGALTTGATYYNGGAGGSGIVIISYPGSTPMMAGGNVTVVSNTVVHTFTSSGYLTPFVNMNNSLRFRLGGPAKLTRTPTVSSSTLTKLTYSAWIKRGKLGTYQSIYGGYIPTGPTNDCVRFTSSDTIDFNIAGGAVGYIGTAQVFRDPAAWYHIFAVVDTTQASSADRMKLWINGVQINQAPSPSPSQNYNLTGWNNAGRIQNIGTDTDGSSFPFDGYMAEVYSIDGQALSPYAFGNFNQYGVWAPVRYAGSYGTNGFYLNFGNTANTTALGFDSSPQGNNWTPTNISLTAGATYDSMTDVPTLTSANVANYAVLNPLQNIITAGSRTIDNGNLRFFSTSASQAVAYSSINLPTTGKFYYEVLVDSAGVTSSTSAIYCGGAYYYQNGTIDGSTAYGASWTTNDILGVSVDIDAGSVTFYKNNSSQGARTGLSPANGISFFCNFDGSNRGCSVNFGQQPFVYTPPAGFLPLNTYNM